MTAFGDATRAGQTRGLHSARRGATGKTGTQRTAVSPCVMLTADPLLERLWKSRGPGRDLTVLGLYGIL